VSQRDFLSELNDAQRAAARHISGPLMVIAGAGSGKTRVLTYRIVHMIQNGIDPFSILSLTFTNKAAKEMKERIANLMGEDNARNIWMELSTVSSRVFFDRKPIELDIRETSASTIQQIVRA